MTGRGHRWTGVGAAFIAAAIARAVHLPELVAVAMAIVSTTMPDWAEIPFYRRDPKTGMKTRSGSVIAHRTLTHWPPVWFLLLAWGIHEGSFPGAIAVGVSVGCMMHILGDAPNPMGIPWILPNQRLKIGKKGWWKSGEHEPFMALTFAAIGFAVWQLVSMWNT